MGGDELQYQGILESALLFLSREPRPMALLLERFLRPETMLELVRGSGRRKAGIQAPALQIAEILPDFPKLRHATAAALLTSLPTDNQAGTFTAEEAAEQSPQMLRSALAFGLLQAEPQAWEQVQEMTLAWQTFLPVRKDIVEAGVAAQKLGAEARKTPSQSKMEKKESLRELLVAARRETSRLEELLGLERRRRTELKEQLAEAVAERQEADSRAASWKKRLAASTQISAREQALIEEADQALQGQLLAQKKLGLLVWERDDLRDCLEDRDRFFALEEEDVPSFHNRPLLEKENYLAARITAANQSFRILVVGGGEPQFRHRDKLNEYAEVMGFTSTWRLAEYVSWHKEMDKLATDMNTRYDALIILHWNRTTFTRKAREVCNQAGQKPCITCYYEGFTSLRETLQECLRQLLDREA